MTPRIAACVAAATLFVTPLLARQPGHVTGIGGIFVTSKDPKALAR